MLIYDMVKMISNGTCEDAAEESGDPFSADEDPGGRVVVQRHQHERRHRPSNHQVDAHVVQHLQYAHRYEGGKQKRNFSWCFKELIVSQKKIDQKLTCRGHKEGVKQTTRQEEEHQREGIDHAGPEVIRRALHIGRIGNEDVRTHHGAQKGQSVRDGVEDLLEDIIATCKNA